MTEATRDPDPPTRSAPWWLAVGAGGAAFACVALVALAIGVAEWLAAGRPFGLRLPWKLAGLYIGAFHGAGVRAVGSGVFGVGVASLSFVDVPTETTLHVTLLLGTAIAAGALWWAGRAVAGRAGGSVGRRLRWGAAVAPAYGLLVFGVSIAVVLRFPSAGITELRVVAWEALAGSLVVAAVAGAAGGFASCGESLAPSEPRGARPIAWIRGGWRMFVALMVLSLGGFLAVAALQTGASSTYVRGLSRMGWSGAIVAGHHALLLPDQLLLMAVPAMGGCLELGGSDSQTSTLCPRALTVRPGWGDLLLADRSSDVLPLSPVWLLFLLAPALATVWGGRAAALDAGSAAERVLRGAGAGVVFASLTAAGVAVSAVSVTRSDQEVLRLGADVGRTVLLGLAWGVIGGALGSSVQTRAQADGVVSAVGSDAEPEPEDRPSPTSV
ncbi:MAG: hypothetical protein ABJC60_04735 [Actinomycetota bacterium]